MMTSPEDECRDVMDTPSTAAIRRILDPEDGCWAIVRFMAEANRERMLVSRMWCFPWEIHRIILGFIESPWEMIEDAVRQREELDRDRELRNIQAWHRRRRWELDTGCIW